MKKHPCFEDIAGFNDRWLVAIGVPLTSILVSMLLFSAAFQVWDWGFIAVCVPMSFVYTSIFWSGMRWMYTRLKLRYPEWNLISKRVFWVFIGFNLLFFVVNGTLDWLFHHLVPGHNDADNTLLEYIATLIFSMLIITLYEAVSFYVTLQKTLAEKALLERQNVESQLDGLRNQVNPHFLFNSLNTLIYLIPEDAEKAVNFVQKLSRVYRYVLESRDAKIIPLQEELEFLNAYIFLQRERFGENLRVHIKDLEQHGSAAIVPLTLQMLFENAIKHNVVSAEKPLTIEVFVENGHLVVRNNHQKKNQVMDSTGVGLQNIRDRYRMLTEREVNLIVSPQYFTVALPMIALERP
jgi:sensor histidine kinase YesM